MHVNEHSLNLKRCQTNGITWWIFTISYFPIHSHSIESIVLIQRYNKDGNESKCMLYNVNIYYKLFVVVWNVEMKYDNKWKVCYLLKQFLENMCAWYSLLHVSYVVVVVVLFLFHSSFNVLFVYYNVTYTTLCITLCTVALFTHLQTCNKMYE